MGMVVAQPVGDWTEKQRVLGLSLRADKTWKCSGNRAGARTPSENC